MSFQEVFSGKRFICCTPTYYIIYYMVGQSIASISDLDGRCIYFRSDILAIDPPTVLYNLHTANAGALVCTYMQKKYIIHNCAYSPACMVHEFPI